MEAMSEENGAASIRNCARLSTNVVIPIPAKNFMQNRFSGRRALATTAQQSGLQSCHQAPIRHPLGLIHLLPSGIDEHGRRRWTQAPICNGAGSTPTAVAHVFAEHIAQSTLQIPSATLSRQLSRLA